jgi:hypothetical protein
MFPDYRKSADCLCPRSVTVLGVFQPCSRAAHDIQARACQNAPKPLNNAHVHPRTGAAEEPSALGGAGAVHFSRTAGSFDLTGEPACRTVKSFCRTAEPSFWVWQIILPRGRAGLPHGRIAGECRAPFLGPKKRFGTRREGGAVRETLLPTRRKVETKPKAQSGRFARSGGVRRQPCAPSGESGRREIDWPAGRAGSGRQNYAASTGEGGSCASIQDSSVRYGGSCSTIEELLIQLRVS